MGLMQDWSAKVGVPAEDLQKEFDERMKAVEGRFKTEQAASNYVLMQMRTKFRAALRTNAIWFEGIVIGKTDPVFYMLNRYNQAKELYEESPQEAVNRGFTDEDGNPLDIREEVGGKPNKTFGHRIDQLKFGKRRDGVPITYKDKAVANIYGIARKKGSDEVKDFRMSLFDFDALREFPLLVPVEFRANLYNEDEGLFEIGHSASTDMQSMVDAPKSFTIDGILEDEIIPVAELADLEQWHDAHEGDFNAYVLTRGMVSSMNLEKERYNNIFLDDLSLELEIDEEGDVAPATLVQVPKDIPIDFAEGSLMYAFARTWRGWSDNDEPGRINLTAISVYVPSEYKEEYEDEVANKATEKAVETANKATDSQAEW